MAGPWTSVQLAVSFRADLYVTRQAQPILTSQP